MNNDNLDCKSLYSNSISLIDKMCISHPCSALISRLRELWKSTFGDSDAFLDAFFETAFSPERALCATINDAVVGALYWFDCECLGEKIAYIYAVATAEKFRGQGICHTLMKHTHQHLKEHGYAGAILSPAEESLFHFYEKMGYKTCVFNSEIVLTEDSLYAFEDKKLTLHKINKIVFEKLRPKFLPNHAVLQENENLDFLETQADFYMGDNFLLTAQKHGTHLQGIEYLGDPSFLPFILQSLKCTSGNFRTIGHDKPLGMYHSFSDETSLPCYLGFAFD